MTLKTKQSQEAEWEALLKIKTTGRDDSISNTVNYPYEPTEYAVLNRLANEGYIRKGNLLLDYGCGKGRVSFFLAYQTRCKAIGIDYDDRMVRCARENQEHAVCAGRTSFVWENAGKYPIPDEADRFYFFNPFATEVLRQVLGRIRTSFYENPRDMLLFFYYPSDEYVALLMGEDDLEFEDEIDCQDLFPGQDSRERIMIFRFGAYMM